MQTLRLIENSLESHSLDEVLDECAAFMADALVVAHNNSFDDPPDMPDTKAFKDELIKGFKGDLIKFYNRIHPLST